MRKYLRNYEIVVENCDNAYIRKWIWTHKLCIKNRKRSITGYKNVFSNWMNSINRV